GRLGAGAARPGGARHACVGGVDLGCRRAPTGPGVRPSHSPATAVAKVHRKPQVEGGLPSHAMNVPDDLRYSKDHEWVRLEDGRVRIGITDYAQDALGDVVFVQIPEIGSRVVAGDSFSEVESTKSVSDIYAPVSGAVVEVNHELADAPQRVNEDPYGEGWLVVIEPDDAGQVDELLDAGAYRALIEG